MFFHHLKSFSPYSGHIYDALKVPFLVKEEGFFGRDNKRFDLMDREGYLPFRELIRDKRAYFISDADLFDFLNVNEHTIDHYLTHGCPGWNWEMKERFAKQFFLGYEGGISDYESNLGITYAGLPYEQQLPYLRTFCLYCLDFLFFEGDLTEDLLYNLGYLQASLYRGFIEINHLLAVSPDGNAAIRLHFESYTKSREIVGKESLNVEEKEAQPIPPVKKVIDAPPKIAQPERIELLCDITEIQKIWMVLTAPVKTKNGTEAAVFSAAELPEFLGAVFSSGAFPDMFIRPQQFAPKRTSKGDMRNLLNTLMYASYNLNREYNRSTNLIQYAGLLKQYFAVFAGSGVDSIKSVMTTYASKGIEVLKESISINPYIEEMLSILKKHKLLH